MKRKAFIVIALALLAGAGFWFFYLRPPAPSDGALVLYGNVDVRQVELGFRVGGRVAEMRFEEGDKVSAGDVLAMLDQQPFEDDMRLAEAVVASETAILRKYETGSRPAEIAQARALVAERQAALQNTILRLQRGEQLVQKGHVSQQLYDDALARRMEAEARLESAQEALELALEGFREEEIAAARANLQMAEARLARARTDLEDTVIVAPSDGVILSRIQEPGGIVSVGSAVYTLSLTNPVWVRTYVAEPDLGRVHPGMKATVATDSAPKHYKGHIGFISPVAEFTPKNVETVDLRTDLVYRLRVIVDDPDHGLRQGMPVTVNLAPPAARAPGP